tara:strand:- start:10229 stop:10531 length:303 start_codon:yes stop_codon:yes gene_type:complete
MTEFYSWTTATEFATALGLIGACVGGVLKVAFTGAGNSRCENINCCCGLVKCARKPKSAAELQVELQAKDLEEGVSLPAPADVVKKGASLTGDAAIGSAP